MYCGQLSQNCSSDQHVGTSGSLNQHKRNLLGNYRSWLTVSRGPSVKQICCPWTHCCPTRIPVFFGMGGQMKNCYVCTLLSVCALIFFKMNCTTPKNTLHHNKFSRNNSSPSTTCASSMDMETSFKQSNLSENSVRFSKSFLKTYPQIFFVCCTSSQNMVNSLKRALQTPSA